VTIEQVLARKRWMRLALPDDVEQCVALAQIIARTPHSQAVALDYLLRQLRHEVWDRHISGAPSRPANLRPSKLAKASGYRTDPERKRTARAKVPPERRSAIALIARLAQIRQATQLSH